MAKKRKANLARPAAANKRPNVSAPDTGKSRVEPPPPSAFLTRACALWCAVVIVELLLNLLMPNSALRNAGISLGARFGLFSYEIVALTAIAFIVYGTLIILAKATSFISSSHRFRYHKAILLVFLVWLVCIFYGASWGKFWHTGKFLGRVDFAFIAPHPVQVFHWIGSDIVVVIVVSTLVPALALSFWIPSLVKSWSPTIQRRLILITGSALGMFFFGAAIGELYSGFGERQYTRSAILYAKYRGENSGPSGALLSDLRWVVKKPAREIATSNHVGIISRPIVSMKQYLAGADLRQTNRLNVVLVVVESMRADQLRVLGGTREVMPTLEALARESRVFANSYTQASHTDYATIVPLSSHYPLRSTTIHAYPQDPAYPRVLIYDVLKAIGYRTAIFSSSNEYWAGMINYLQTGNIDRFFHAANFKGPTYVMDGDTGLADWVKATKHAGSVDDRFTVGEAIRWVDTLNDNEPFFMYLNFQNSHVPYVVPDEFPRRFSPPRLDFTIRFGHIPEDKITAAKDVYADSLAYVDSQISRLIKYLQKKGLWERTLVVVTGDHGQAFYEHGFTSHAGAIFNEVMKVPLIIRAPGLKPGLDERPAQHVDILPSILDLLALPSHPSCQGISLFDPNPNPNRSIYMLAQTPLAHQYGIVRSRFKLVYDEERRQYSLYDLAADPTEKNDLAASRSTLVQELAIRLQTWRKLQIDYYADRSLYSREYPPIVAE
jgi:arylsulfatase A-like enzyme